MRNIEYKKVRLKAEWMGHPKGSILMLNAMKVADLVSRNSAKIITEKNEEGLKAKDVASPPIDKMITKPVRQKRV